jgi:hypothetical protein
MLLVLLVLLLMVVMVAPMAYLRLYVLSYRCRHRHCLHQQ